MATPPKGEKRVRIESAVQGSLFAHDFLTESVVELADWQALDDAALDELDSALRDLFDRFPIAQTPNESQTEDDLIWPILEHLGWTASLRQQNLSAQGRDRRARRPAVRRRGGQGPCQHLRRGMEAL